MQIHAHGTGATVLELMVTLTIAAILLVAGVPSFQHYLHRQHVRAAIEQLHHDLMLARSEAVYRNAIVIACPGAPESGCAMGSDWSPGWIVFEDSDGDRTLSGDETVIRYGQLMQTVHVLTTAGRGPLRFFPDGSAPGTNMSISLCGLGGPPDARKLVVSNIGRIRRDTWPDLDASRCPA
ncbi:MAG: GspH/FimT family pseudopilin [Xanthomonadales bacterium]